MSRSRLAVSRGHVRKLARRPVAGWPPVGPSGQRPETNPPAEGVGFEPTVPCDTTVFETVRFGHSRIPPAKRLAAGPERRIRR